METIQLPSIGRIVHYVLPDDSPRKGEHRAALITGTNLDSTDVNINVYFDQPDDLHDVKVFHVQCRVVGAKHDESASPGTWHWPERSEPLPPTQIEPTPQKLDPPAQ